MKGRDFVKKRLEIFFPFSFSFLFFFFFNPSLPPRVHFSREIRRDVEAESRLKTKKLSCFLPFINIIIIIIIELENDEAGDTNCPGIRFSPSLSSYPPIIKNDTENTRGDQVNIVTGSFKTSMPRTLPEGIVFIKIQRGGREKGGKKGGKKEDRGIWSRLMARL